MGSSLKVRESNIELLRIISMVFIIIFHYVANCSYQYSGMSFSTLIIESFWFLGELGVNLFILITGYYLCKSKPTIKKFFLLVFEVLFYNLLNYFIGYIVGYNDFRGDLAILFPLVTSKYWFMSAYLLVYVLSPFFNKLILKFTKREYQKFLLINFVIWSIIPTIFGIFYNSSEDVMFYNRFIWLSFMYFVGGYIRAYGIKFLNSKKTSLSVSLITFSIMSLSIIYFYLFRDVFSRLGLTDVAYLWTPNNIFMFILSISVFMFFVKLRIKSNLVINSLASSVFGIYLLHDGSFKKYMWRNWFHSSVNIYSDCFLIHIFLTTILIFLVGFWIDTFRQLLEKVVIKKIFNLKAWNDVYKDFKFIAVKFIDKLL